ncbi:hypothetical protein [Mitsuokella jalaludinii]|uniref:hypothetical protein n=1 Tax=Mitsuokella jalaludinii TaxID=187979 RepID=UPI00307B0384
MSQIIESAVKPLPLSMGSVNSALDDYPLETKEAHFFVTEVLDVLAKEVHENGK